jgi:hypothetical protein
MKKNLLTAACIAGFLCLSVFSVRADVSQKVLQSFHSVFSKASNIRWIEYADHYYVSFNQNDVIVRANFDMAGSLLNSIRYYREQQLPLNILCKIKKSYPSKVINNVTEVSNQEGIVYFIMLQDDKSWVKIKSDETATFEIVDKFKKA